MQTSWEPFSSAKIHASWAPFFECERQKPYYHELLDFVENAYQKTTVFPPKNQIFSPFSTDKNHILVVILGQDPYHTPGAAHGLAFSVPDQAKIPPSLKNIFKEIQNDFNPTGVVKNTTPLENPDNPNPTSVVKNTTLLKHQTGNLTAWANQGVFLLNNTLTVEAHKAGSHRHKGWEIFTTSVIKYLDKTQPHLVFMLWGNDAKSKKSLIDPKKHLVLEAPHPSPLSAHTGFFGNHHFSQANDFLASHNLPIIKW